MKFTPKSETTRQFIIETTAKIFNTKGYAGTSVSDLTEATKLSKGSIYGNFESKEELAIAAFEYNVMRRVGIIMAGVNSCKTYRAKLMVHIELFYGSSKAMLAEGGCPLMNTAVESDDTHEGLRKKAAEGLLNWKAAIESIITEGMKAKEFRADTDANKIALSIIALIEGAILISKATKNSHSLSIILDSAKDLVDLITVKKD